MHDEAQVIVVDDNKDAAEALARLLELDGYTVRIALDGDSALALIDELRPHCVLLDIEMPGIDGCELSRRLRETHGDDIVLIAVTGWDEEREGVAETFVRVDHYLRKPIDSTALRKLLPPAGR